jgi:hypothetical protein
MVHAQKLSERVKAQKARISELEHALSQALAVGGAEGSHPLLQSTALRETQEELELENIYDTGFRDVSDAIGSLSIGLDGQSKYHGESAGSEVCENMQSLHFLESSLSGVDSISKTCYNR